MRVRKNKNRNVALNCLALAAGMAMLAYASVPLYDLFCRMTGFGGTTTDKIALPKTISDRSIEVRFNADIDAGLPWEFAPGEPRVRLKIGEEGITHYVAKNLTNKPVTGHAVYNVVPHKAGPYFAKIECFCFTDQTLQPYQKVNMPVAYFIDPAILDDPEMKDVTSIALSYTFFPSKTQAKQKEKGNNK